MKPRYTRAPLSLLSALVLCLAQRRLVPAPIPDRQTEKCSA